MCRVNKIANLYLLNPTALNSEPYIYIFWPYDFQFMSCGRSSISLIYKVALWLHLVVSTNYARTQAFHGVEGEHDLWCRWRVHIQMDWQHQHVRCVSVTVLGNQNEWWWGYGQVIFHDHLRHGDLGWEKFSVVGIRYTYVECHFEHLQQIFRV